MAVAPAAAALMAVVVRVRHVADLAVDQNTVVVVLAASTAVVEVLPNTAAGVVGKLEAAVGVAVVVVTGAAPVRRAQAELITARSVSGEIALLMASRVMAGDEHT